MGTSDAVSGGSSGSCANNRGLNGSRDMLCTIMCIYASVFRPSTAWPTPSVGSSNTPSLLHHVRVSVCPEEYSHITHSSWVATRRGLHKPVSSSPPFKTGLAPLRASGLTPSVLLRGQT